MAFEGGFQKGHDWLRRGEGGQNSQKIGHVVYGWPLICIQIHQFSAEKELVNQTFMNVKIHTTIADASFIPDKQKIIIMK